MDRRTFLKGVAGTGAVAVAGGAGFAWWASQGADQWATEAALVRQPLTPESVAGTDRLRELVRYATLAANSHNTQPWRFTLGGGGIVILPDLARRLPEVDSDDHHLFASLGAAAENLVHAAPIVGLRATPRFDTAGDGSIPVALESRNMEVSELADAIPKRQCTRAPYDGRAVPAEHLRALEDAGRGDGVEVLLVSEPRRVEDILAFIVDGNTRQIGDPDFVAELKRWVRFSYADALATRDGLFAKSSGNPVLPGPVGRLIFGWVFTADAENRKIATEVRSSAGIAVFVSEKSDKPHWVEAGRCYQRFALRATALGIRHAFLNQPVEVAEIRQRFAAHLGIGDRRPDLVLRFGYGSEMPKSLRRPVAAVLV